MSLTSPAVIWRYAPGYVWLNQEAKFSGLVMNIGHTRILRGMTLGGYDRELTLKVLEELIP